MTRDTDPRAVTDRITRTFTMALDIDASPEDVWRALTDAGELVRWFPLQARVTPGEGGSMFWGWDDRWAWESAIETWQPGERLTLVENRPAFDAQGAPLPTAATRMAMEFTLETDAGKTRLRIVHSGFGAGADWDDELDSVSAGWQFELRSLRHYLERHRGRDRIHAFAQRISSLSPAAIWSRLFGDDGLRLDQPLERVNSPAREGTPCTLRVAGSHTLTGRIAWHNPGHDLFIIVDALDDGVLRWSTWRAAGETGVQMWIASYAPAAGYLVHELAQVMTPLLDGTAEPLLNVDRTRS